jgi:hypothetical protein
MEAIVEMGDKYSNHLPISDVITKPILLVTNTSILFGNITQTQEANTT